MKGNLKKWSIVGCIVIIILAITWGMGKFPTAKEEASMPPAIENVDENEESDMATGATPLDEYQTVAVPEGKPEPVEPEDIKVNGDNSFTVKLSVSSEAVVQNMDLLDQSKHELIPEDGIIFAEKDVIAYEGESVFDVLLREMKNAKIHMEYVDTPMYNSAYIEGINNLYEFDAGELSGWMYKVNGWFPNYGCSRYQLQPDDQIEWVYTCDLGRDVKGELQ